MYLRSNFSQKSILKIPEMAFQRFGISKFLGGECPRTPLDLCRHKCALVRYRAGSAPGTGKLQVTRTPISGYLNVTNNKLYYRSVKLTNFTCEFNIAILNFVCICIYQTNYPSPKNQEEQV